MELNIREYAIRISIIEVVGRLEAFTVPRLREEIDRLINSGHANFVVDLSNTEFMDSAGMSALVSLLKRSRQNGGDVVLVRPKEPAANRILTLTRFDQVFKMANDRNEAIKLY